jgi:ATP-dependent Clp protease ATP-binding subunit ClpC
LEDPIAEEILKGDLHEGDILEIDVDTETKELKILDKPKNKKKKETKNES